MKNIHKVPNLLLEKMVLGELSPIEEKEIMFRLKKEKNGNKRLEKIKESNTQILKQYPPDKMAQLITEKYEQETVKIPLKRQLRYLVPAASLLVLLMVLILSWPKDQIPKTDVPGSYTGIKGIPELYIYRKKGIRQELLKKNDKVQEGQRLQLSFDPKKDEYGVIFSLDGNGVITPHYPYNIIESTRLIPGKKVVLKDSYELDDAPKYEKFFLITSKQEINAENILKKAEELSKNPDNAEKTINTLFPNLNIVTKPLIKVEPQ